VKTTKNAQSWIHRLRIRLEEVKKVKIEVDLGDGWVKIFKEDVKYSNIIIHEIKRIHLYLVDANENPKRS
jgi:hypothetical protein